MMNLGMNGAGSMSRVTNTLITAGKKKKNKKKKDKDKSGDSVQLSAKEPKKSKETQAVSEVKNKSGTAWDDPEQYRVKPGDTVELCQMATAPPEGIPDDDTLKEMLSETLGEIIPLAEKLNIEDSRALLVVLQGMDASGKGGIIEHVLSGRAVITEDGKEKEHNFSSAWRHAASFGKPTQAEWTHPKGFIGRIEEELPPAGRIGSFDRSHYEDRVTVEVEGLPLMHAGEKIEPHTQRWTEVLESRTQMIKDYETQWAEGFQQDAGEPSVPIRTVKFWNHQSWDVQTAELQERREKERAYHKVKKGDAEIHNSAEKYNAYQREWGETIAATSTEAAPWYVLPAENRHYQRLMAAKIVLSQLQDMDPQYAELPPMDESWELAKEPPAGLNCPYSRSA